MIISRTCKCCCDFDCLQRMQRKSKATIFTQWRASLCISHMQWSSPSANDLLVLLRTVNFSLGLSAALEFFRAQKARFSGRIPDYDSALFRWLYITLEIATNSISHCNKAKLGFIKDISVFSCKLKHALGKLVVVLLLLDCVVKGGMPEIFFSVCNQKSF